MTAVAMVANILGQASTPAHAEPSDPGHSPAAGARAVPGASVDGVALRVPPQVPDKWSHFLHGTPYYKYDSVQGVKKAAKRKGKSKAIDLDWHMTKDGVLVNTHWGQPLKYGFHDPKHKIRKNAKIEDLTWAQVKRLRAHGYRISRAEEIFNLCAKKGVRMEFEAKASKDFEKPAAWQKVRKLADKYHMRQKGKIQVKTIARPSSHKAAARRLAQARKAGFVTFLLPRDWGKKKISKKEFVPVTSYVRGHPHWGA